MPCYGQMRKSVLGLKELYLANTGVQLFIIKVILLREYTYIQISQNIQSFFQYRKADCKYLSPRHYEFASFARFYLYKGKEYDMPMLIFSLLIYVLLVN